MKEDRTLDDRTVMVDVRAVKDAPEDMAHFLVVVDGPRQGRWIELSAEPLLLGRGRSAQFDLGDRTVSSRHCRLGFEHDRLVVEDLGSKNGTFVDGEPVTRPRELPLGSTLQVGSSRLKHELRSRSEVRQQERLTADLDKAADYVLALLPEPLVSDAVTLDWRFIPSAKLGGDAFGYHWLDDDRFALYLLDVCGHGAGSALHSVSIISVLRKQTLPGVDFARPDRVLTALNKAFRMEDHGGMYFTIWYGIYRASRRRLSFSSAGHPPALLAAGGAGGSRQLRTPRPAAGLFEDTSYPAEETEVPPGSRLYLFSDGAFEFETHEGRDWTFEELLELLAASPAATAEEPERVERAIRRTMKGEQFDDDFSLLVAEFH